MAILQSDIYERGYFSKIWMEYYCLDKNNAYQLQNLNFADISGAQKPTWAKFLEFDFFI